MSAFLRACGHSLFLIASALLSLPAHAMALAGDHSLVAYTQDGHRTRIGTVSFAAAGQGLARVRVQMDHSVMLDHFLSMREFKCLPAAQEVTCHVPYPYAHPGTVSEQDLQWLDHQLLFFYKKPADFGAKLWNGIIFKWRLTSDGLEGLPQAVDLNLISAPPEKLDVPPYGPFERDDFPPDVRWVKRLRIE